MKSIGGLALIMLNGELCYVLDKKIAEHFTNIAQTLNIRFNKPESQCTARTCATMPCFAGATCTDGAIYSCACPTGFSGVSCEQFNECTSDPCHNGATCTDLPAGFSCNCPSGVTGSLCDVNIDECASSPCRNNATCTDGIDEYNCTCSSGFVGHDCETNIDECASSPCSSGGTCRDQIAGFQCICPMGSTGPLCDVNINECAPSPCRNGATCEDGIASFQCRCPSGFTGRLCETELVECDSSPCKNGGTCSDLVDGFICMCERGFTGDECQTNVDDCASVPCGNGGTCVDEVDSFTCRCPVGFTGLRCETNLNECASSPCQNGGTCVENGIGKFECVCHIGFTGVMCETNIDDCISFPCQNGGLCRDGIAGFSCECSQGFTGSLCSTEIDECAPTPCQNGATCMDKLAGFDCQCPDGLTGETCQHAKSLRDKLALLCKAENVSLLYNETTGRLGWSESNVASVDFCDSSHFVFVADIQQTSGSVMTIFEGTAMGRLVSLESDGVENVIKYKENGVVSKESSTVTLDDEVPHRVLVVSTSTQLKVYIDSPSTEEIFTQWTPLPGAGTVTTGGSQSGFVRNAASACIVDSADLPRCLYACADSPCNNGGTCVDNYAGRHYCVCPYGYTGDNCESMQTVMSFGNVSRATYPLDATNVTTFGFSYRTTSNQGNIFSYVIGNNAVSVRFDGNLALNLNCDGTTQTAALPDAYADGRWHRVETSIDASLVQIVVDGVATAQLAPMCTVVDAASGDVTLGAGDYDGCIRDVTINGNSIDSQRVVLHDAAFGCALSTAHFYGISKLQFNVSTTFNRTANVVALRLKTECDTGLVYYTRQSQSDADPTPTDFFAIRIVGGKVQFRFQTSALAAAEIASTQRIDDNAWHTVIASKMGVSGSLRVDGASTSGMVQGSLESLDVDGDVCLGGAPDSRHGLDDYRGFVGCVQDVEEDRVMRDLRAYKASRFVTAGKCVPESPCH